jgi:UDP-3-O-[3-hydroxymyristoyl] glucosamine N-acyltransferase
VVAVTLADIVAITGGKLVGNERHSITGVSDLKDANSNSLCFITDRIYLDQLKKTAAGAVLLTEDLADNCPVNTIIVENPQLAYAKAASLLYPFTPLSIGIHKTAILGEGCELGRNVSVAAHSVIHETAIIGDECYIGPACIIGPGVTLGKRCRLHGNITVVGQSIIGDDVNLHPGVVIGSDGFGFTRDGEEWFKIPQAGRVILGNNVDIGANSTIDRGTIHDTVIEEGVKIDNQVHIAHNVRIGANTIIAGCAAIAGSVTIGRNCMIGGAVGIVDHITIADGTVLTAMTFVSSPLKQAGIYSSGMPAQDNKQWRKNMVRLARLDDMARDLKKLITGFRKE